MKKFKRQLSTVYKTYDGETYVFKNGVAKIPGMFHKPSGAPYTITIKEFKELTHGENN